MANNKNNPVLYIVVPCFNEQEVLPSSNEKLLNLMTLMKEQSLVSRDSKLLYVDDGSRDGTWEIIS